MTNCIHFFLQFRQADPSQLMDSKLRCVFEMPDDGSNTAASVGASSNSTTATESSAPAADKLTSGEEKLHQSSVPSQQQPATAPNAAKLMSQITAGTEEIKKLRAECSSLRQENITLRVTKNN